MDPTSAAPQLRALPTQGRLALPTRGPVSPHQIARVERYPIWVGDARVEVERYTPHRLLPGQLPLAFLHGWGMSPAAYRVGLQAMVGRGFSVHAFALPGYAGSTPLPWQACRIRDYAQRVEDSLDQVGFDGPIHLTGHSLGGGLALEVAAIRPDLVARVTVVCPIGGASDGPSPWPTMARSFLREGGTAGLVGFLRSAAPAIRRSVLTVAASGLAARSVDLSDRVSAAAARGIDVHLILADRDAIVPPGALAKPVHGVRVTFVSGSHSWPHLEPDRWADLTVA